MAQYTVQKGDTLWDIANRNNTTVANLQSANPQITNPNLIYAGNVINIPDAVASTPSTTAEAPAQTSPTTGTSTAPTVPDYSQYQYDASTNQSYLDALAALNQAQANKPTYAGTYDSQVEDFYNQIVNREKFSYDLNSDMLYNQYKDQHVNLGQMAMKDTMGQAAALTGGYGSSYSQSVGQQAYNAYLQQLNDVVPELYGMALDQYNAEGDQLAQNYALAADLRDTEYDRYQDDLDRHLQEVDYLTGRADTEYSRGESNWYTGIQLGKADEETARQNQKEERDYYANLIAATGFTPSAEQMAAAGMTQAEVDALKLSYTQQQQAATAKSVSTNTDNTDDDKPGNDNGGLALDKIKRLQEALGVDADGDWGPVSKAKAQELLGTSDLQEAYMKFIQGGLNPNVPVTDIKNVDLGTRDGQNAARSSINNVIEEAGKEYGLTAAEIAQLKKELNPRGYTK